MIVIPPITITPAMLTSSIAEPDPLNGEAEWVSGATYAYLDEVILASTHKKYKRVIAGAGTTAPNLDSTNWTEVGPTNKWAMFDLYNTTGTTYTGTLSLDIALTDRINTIVLIGMSMQDITVTITSSGTPIYSSTNTLTTRNVTDYYDYFFADFSFQNALLLRNIPPILNGVVHITSTVSGSITSVILGTAETIGYTQQRHRNDALNFSIIEKDVFGNSILTPRRSVPKTSQSIVVKKRDVSKVLRLRESLNAKPAVWAGLSDSNEAYFNSLLILGIYKDFSLSLAYPDYAICNLELEEL